MIKRKYGARTAWNRISERNYQELYLETDDFTGHVTRLEMIRVTDPLFVQYTEQALQIAGDGYVWIQQFPAGKQHVITTMFNDQWQLVQTYIDICLRHGRDATGIFWDDLMLDLVLLPSGEYFVLDAEELETALTAGEITREDYDRSWQEINRLQQQIRTARFVPSPLACAHADLFRQMNKSR